MWPFSFSKVSCDPHEAYIENGLKTIQELVKSQDYENALKGCEELLSVLPGHKKAFRVCEKVRKLWRSDRYHKIKMAMKEISPIWQTKNYEKLLSIYETFDRYLPDCEEIQKMIIKLHQLVDSEHKAQIDLYVGKNLKNIGALIKRREYKKAIDLCLDVKEKSSNDVRIIKALQSSKRLYADEKLSHRWEFLKKEKYEELLYMYAQLLHLDPDYKKLHRLIRQCEKFIIQHRIKEKEAFIATSLRKIRVLYREGKYQKTLQGCRELLAIDPNNFIAQWFFFWAYREDAKLKDLELASQMLKSWKRMGEELSQSVAQFGAKEGLKGVCRI